MKLDDGGEIDEWVPRQFIAMCEKSRFDKKDSAEIDRLVQDGFVPIIRKAQGFVRYYWLDTGAG